MDLLLITTKEIVMLSNVEDHTQKKSVKEKIKVVKKKGTYMTK